MSVPVRIGDAGTSVTVDPHGGRLTALVIDRTDVLVHHAEVLSGGLYPMVPWAGRVAFGRFTFDGETHQLAIRMPPHALHGVGMDLTWSVAETSDTDVLLRADLGAAGTSWPFGGQAEHHIRLAQGALRLRLTVSAAQRMPVMLGWHPWFRRQLHECGPAARLDVDAEWMYELDEVAIPTGSCVPPSTRPWDNCFTGLRDNPAIEWPEGPRLQLASDCDHWVVFDERAHAICIEPQTDAPDAFNRSPEVLAAGQQRSATFDITW